MELIVMVINYYIFFLAISVSPCVNNPCENNGTCSVDVNGNATCTCDGNWNGTYCQGNVICKAYNWFEQQDVKE